MKHKHAEVIKQWADGAQIQWRFSNEAEWHDLNNDKPSWDEMLQYRTKPPAPKWPETIMTSNDLSEAFDANKMLIVALEDVANAAIAHACETGQLVLPDPDRDMKIAIAAWSAGVNSQSSLELKSIIKEATK